MAMKRSVEQTKQKLLLAEVPLYKLQITNYM
jgi:hypothetical protein